MGAGHRRRMAEISLAASREHKCYAGGQQRRCESPTVVNSGAIPAACMPTYIAAHDGLDSVSTPAVSPPNSAVPPTMMAAQSKLLFHLNTYYNERVRTRKSSISKTVREVCKIVQDVLKEVEMQEPRFISSLTEMNNHFDGLQVISPTEFEVVLYLNQMGVFNFVDDGTIPGCAVLKLSDGRKRSMSLWVEFITASGYLSARKIRSRFQVPMFVYQRHPRPRRTRSTTSL